VSLRDGRTHESPSSDLAVTLVLLVPIREQEASQACLEVPLNQKSFPQGEIERESHFGSSAQHRSNWETNQKTSVTARVATKCDSCVYHPLKDTSGGGGGGAPKAELGRRWTDHNLLVKSGLRSYEPETMALIAADSSPVVEGCCQSGIDWASMHIASHRRSWWPQCYDECRSGVETWRIQLRMTCVMPRR